MKDLKEVGALDSVADRSDKSIEFAPIRLLWSLPPFLLRLCSNSCAPQSPAKPITDDVMHLVYRGLAANRTMYQLVNTENDFTKSGIVVWMSLANCQNIKIVLHVFHEVNWSYQFPLLALNVMGDGIATDDDDDGDDVDEGGNNTALVRSIAAETADSIIGTW